MIGDILAFRAKTNWYRKLIGKFSTSQYAHVAVQFTDTELIESTLLGGVKTIFIKDAIKRSGEMDRYRVDISESNRLRVIEFMLSKRGNSYDIWGFIYLSVLILTFSRTKMNKWQNRNSYTCSEIIAESFGQVGIKFRDHIPHSNISPGDIVNSRAVKKVNYS